MLSSLDKPSGMKIQVFYTVRLSRTFVSTFQQTYCHIPYMAQIAEEDCDVLPGMFIVLCLFGSGFFLFILQINIALSYSRHGCPAWLSRSIIALVFYHFRSEMCFLSILPSADSYHVSYGPGPKLVFSVSAVFLVGVAAVAVLCPHDVQLLPPPSTSWVFLGSWCPPGRPHEPSTRGWIGLFSKWKNILLLLFNLSLQTKMRKSLSEQTGSSENKNPLY